jgi:hypothetical protein
MLPFEPIDVEPQRGEQAAGHPSAAGDDRHLPGGEGLKQDGRAPLPVAALVVGKQEDVGEVELVPVGADREWSGEALDEGETLALARAEDEPLALAEGDAAALGEGEGVGSEQPAAAPAQAKVGGETAKLKELADAPPPTALASAAPVAEKLPAPSAATPSYAACAPAERVSVTLYSAEVARRRAAPLPPLPPPPASRRRAPDAEQLTALCTIVALDAALVTTPSTLCVTLNKHAAPPLVPGGSDSVGVVVCEKRVVLEVRQAHGGGDLSVHGVMFGHGLVSGELHVEYAQRASGNLRRCPRLHQGGFDCCLDR